MANDKCMYGCRRIPTTPEFGDVCNQCMKVFYLSMMEYKPAIARVRELHKPVKSWKGIDHTEIVGCYECEETGSGREYWVEYPCPTIKALDGEA